MARLIKDYSQRSSWYTNYIASPDRLTVEPAGGCPYYPQDPVMRFELRDGERPTYDATRTPARERIQLQHDSFFRAGTSSYNGVPTYGVYGVSWAAKFESGWPNTTQDRWQMTVQLHGQTLDQSLWMHEVRDTRTRLNHNAGRSSPRYGNTYAPMDAGNWHHYAVVWRHSQGNDGFLRYYRDGVLLQEYSGEPTTTEVNPAYLIIGIYRAATINGTAVWRISGLRVHDGYVPPITLGSGDPDPGSDPDPDPPPPDPEPNPGPVQPPPPVVTARQPQISGTFVNTVPYSVDYAHAPANAKLYVGFAPANSSVLHTVTGTGNVTGTLSVPNDAALTQYFYAALHNDANVKVAETVYNIRTTVTVNNPPDPDPEIPPDPPVDPSSEELAAARAKIVTLTAERDVLAAKIAAAKTALG